MILSIGGTTVELMCSDTKLQEAIQKHYRYYLSEENYSGNKLEVEVLNQPEQVWPGHEEIIFIDQTLEVNLPECIGRLDLGRGLSKMTFRHNQAMNTFDYVLRIIFAWHIFKQGGLMLHACGVARYQKGFIFLGPSGSGKSTIARLSADYDVGSDDLVILTKDATTWQLHATPFWNQYIPKKPVKPISINALFVLKQDADVFLSYMTQATLIARLIANSPVINRCATLIQDLMDRCIQLCRSTRVFELHFQPNASFWEKIDQSQV